MDDIKGDGKGERRDLRMILGEMEKVEGETMILREREKGEGENKG